MDVPLPLTASERSLRASLAAHTRWASTSTADRRRQAERGQAALRAKLAREIDPDGIMPPAELDRRLSNAVAAHFAKLALASAKARRGAA